MRKKNEMNLSENFRKFLFASFALLLFFLPIYSQQTAESFYRQGMEQIKTFKYQAAIPLFTEAIKRKPDYLEAYFERGKARENNSFDLSGSLSDIEKVIELNPSDGEAYYERALIRSAQSVKRPANAPPLTEEDYSLLSKNMLADYDSAIGYGYKTKDIYFRRAQLKCHELDRCQDAIADYDQASALDPGDFFIYVDRSRAKELSGDFAAAVADLRQVINLYNLKKDEKKDDTLKEKFGDKGELVAVSMALINLSGKLIRTGENEAALEAINQAITLNPRMGYESRGQYRLNFGDLNEAIADCDRVIELDPNAGTAYIRRGIALTLQGKTAEGQKDMDRGAELSPHLRERIPEMLEGAREGRQQRKLPISEK